MLKKGPVRIGRITFRLKTILWYLKRPRLYPQLFRIIILKLSPYAKKEVERWCWERAMTTSEAIAKIVGSPPSECVQEKFKEIFTTAEVASKRCPIKMGGPGNLNILYWVAEYLEAKNVIETGVAYGWSSLAILLSIAKRENSMLISTDMPNSNLNNEDYVGCVVPPELKTHWQIIPYADYDALPKALKQFYQIDMCHYDSDKSYKGRMWAYLRLWNALKPGGCFISDDIGDNLGFRDFCNQINMDPIIVRTPTATGVKYVGILIKNKSN